MQRPCSKSGHTVFQEEKEGRCGFKELRGDEGEYKRM